MEVLVPYRVADPKTRLAPVLDADEREAFAARMLEDVLGALARTAADPTLLATARPPPPAGPPPAGEEVPVVVDDRPLTEAVNARLADREPGADDPLGVVMADLALATPAALDRLFAADGDVVLVPGRGGGTNAFVARHPGFRVDYHGASYRDHRDACEALGAEVGVVDSYRLSTDVDEPADLVEVLLHGEGRAADWLGERVALSVDEAENRVGVERVGASPEDADR
jgi:2-phospho-L-lactate guanylyltransferase